jgi:hypothetical protein
MLTVKSEVRVFFIFNQWISSSFIKFDANKYDWIPCYKIVLMTKPWSLFEVETLTVALMSMTNKV